MLCNTTTVLVAAHADWLTYGSALQDHCHRLSLRKKQQQSETAVTAKPQSSPLPLVGHDQAETGSCHSPQHSHKHSCPAAATAHGSWTSRAVLLRDSTALHCLLNSCCNKAIIVLHLSISQGTYIGVQTVKASPVFVWRACKRTFVHCMNVLYFTQYPLQRPLLWHKYLTRALCVSFHSLAARFLLMRRHCL